MEEVEGRGVADGVDGGGQEVVYKDDNWDSDDEEDEDQDSDDTFQAHIFGRISLRISLI